MARIIISPESQIQRLHGLETRIREIAEGDVQQLLTKPTERRWSVAEVLEHMYLGYLAYRPKFEHAISVLQPGEQWEMLKSRRLPSFLFKGFAPKDGRIRYKMKTTKIFEPDQLPRTSDETTFRQVLTDFYASLDHLRELAQKSQKLQVQGHRFPSAIGPVVSFNLPEAVEFILRHNERHLFQIEQTLLQLEAGSVQNSLAV